MPVAAIKSLVRRFLSKSWTDRCLVMEALLALFFARILTLCIPFRRLAKGLGGTGHESPAVVPMNHECAAARIAWAIGVVSPLVPWDSRCLTKALAGWGMLVLRGIYGTVYLGAGKDSAVSGGHLFHAWLRCGSHYVTGGEEVDRYVILTSFARVHDSVSIERS